jgi:hypothetical protein
MTPKLTPTKLSVIKRMKEGERLFRSGGINPRVHLSNGRCTFPTFDKLKSLGLIEPTPRGEKQLYDIYQLTAKGRKIEA